MSQRLKKYTNNQKLTTLQVIPQTANKPDQLKLLFPGFDPKGEYHFGTLAQREIKAYISMYIALPPFLYQMTTAAKHVSPRTTTHEGWLQQIQQTTTTKH